MVEKINEELMNEDKLVVPVRQRHSEEKSFC
jgi:hypothetical protein